MTLILIFQIATLLGYLDSQDRSLVDQLAVAQNLEPLMITGLSRLTALTKFAELSKEADCVRTCQLIRNDQIFQLMYLILILNTQGMIQNSFSGICQLRRSYITLLQRKLSAAKCAFKEYAQIRRVDKIIRKFYYQICQMFWIIASWIYDMKVVGMQTAAHYEMQIQNVLPNRNMHVDNFRFGNASLECITKQVQACRQLYKRYANLKSHSNVVRQLDFDT